MRVFRAPARTLTPTLSLEAGFAQKPRPCGNLLAGRASDGGPIWQLMLFRRIGPPSLARPANCLLDIREFFVQSPEREREKCCALRRAIFLRSLQPCQVRNEGVGDWGADAGGFVVAGAGAEAGDGGLAAAVHVGVFSEGDVVEVGRIVG